MLVRRLVLTVALAFSLAACGGGDEAEQQPATEPPAATEPLETEPVTVPDEDEEEAPHDVASAAAALRADPADQK